jgi:hypothetical protein
MDLTNEAAPDMTTFYYDPVLDVHHRLPVSLAMTTSYYSAPQAPEDSKRLFEAACVSMGLTDTPSLPLRPSRAYSSALILAREWGYTDIEARLVGAIEQSYEPSWDSSTGEFTWGMGLNEPHPRGQFNAFLAAAEATGPDMWTRLSEAPLEPCPQIVGVDFPTMALSQAEWIGDVLHLGLAPLTEDGNSRTSFGLIGADPGDWTVDGVDGSAVTQGRDGLLISVPLVRRDVTIRRV